MAVIPDLRWRKTQVGVGFARHDRHTSATKIAYDTSFTVLGAIGLCYLLNGHDAVSAAGDLSQSQGPVSSQLCVDRAGDPGIPGHRLAAAADGGIFRRHPADALFAGDRHSVDLDRLCWCWRWRPAIRWCLVAAMLVGLGSVVFHPEASRVARMASGGRYGLAQSVFQVRRQYRPGDQSADRALLVATYGGQRSMVRYAGLALLAIVILYQVGTWYKRITDWRASRSHVHVKHPRTIAHGGDPRAADFAGAGLFQIHLSRLHRQLLHLLLDRKV